MPRVFITGDACHTHSAKAGQGMNVSMQDGFNIAWKLGQVISGRSSTELLRTYSAERQVAAKNLIEFDKDGRRSWRLRRRAAGQDLPRGLLRQDRGVPCRVLTEYTESMITTPTTHQELAAGFPIGKRFKSARVKRSCDANFIHLGHEPAPTVAGASMSSPIRPRRSWMARWQRRGRWLAGGESKVAALAAWLESDPPLPGRVSPGG